MDRLTSPDISELPELPGRPDARGPERASMRVCVCTIVHHPEDARILHRQIRALLDAGHLVTYIAPFRERHVTPWREVRAVDVPRATGRSRLAALRAARRALLEHAPEAAVVLIHDPELLLALGPLRRAMAVAGSGPAIVWDVHEDTAAALVTKQWLPRPLRRLLGPVVRATERRAERRIDLLLAEQGYRVRFRRQHPVIPNTTYVPQRRPQRSGDQRVVYLGHLSHARGADDMIALARRLHDDGISVELVGGADPRVRPPLREAHRAGWLTWYGFIPNDQAMRILDGALAGLALLHDVPNYRHSLPTKIVEYMARGVPVITTPLPYAAAIVDSAGCGFTVPHGDREAAARAIQRLRDDAALRDQLSERGHRAALARFHWPTQATTFVGRLRALAEAPRPAATRTSARSGSAVRGSTGT